MKHGPIALIDENVPVIVLAPHDDLFEKTLSNVEEVMARGGRVVMISDAAGVARVADRLAFGIAVPSCDPFVAPLLYAIPIQLLAYHTAVIKGTDVDQPRNLGEERNGRIGSPELSLTPVSAEKIQAPLSVP